MITALLPPWKNELCQPQAVKNSTVHYSCICKSIWGLARSWFLTAIKIQCTKNDPWARRKNKKIIIFLIWNTVEESLLNKKGGENCKFNRSILDNTEQWHKICISIVTQYFKLIEEENKREKHSLSLYHSLFQKEYFDKAFKIIRTCLRGLSDAKSWKYILLYCKQKCWKRLYDQLPWAWMKLILLKLINTHDSVAKATCISALTKFLTPFIVKKWWVADFK